MMLEIESLVLQRVNLRTRMPFRYGIAVMEQVPHVFVEVRLRIDEVSHRGLSADHLPPKWFTKDPTRPVDDEVIEMQTVVRSAADLAVGIRAATPFDLWWSLYERMEDRRRARGWPPLLAHFGTSLVERAVLDAFCRAKAAPFHRLLRDGVLGVQLERIHPELCGMPVSALLPSGPRDRVAVRHTVGLADPIDRRDLVDPIGDGLPETLDDNIAAYGLRHFKIKFTGPADIPRVERILTVVADRVGGAARFTLDGNESFGTVKAFREMWAAIERLPVWPALREGLICVEQPLHRDVALSDRAQADLMAWTERPPLIIDESDAGLENVRRAVEGGYIGASHKNCKGVFKGVANACLLNHRMKAAPGSRLLQTGEDLANIGPISLLQDLAVQSCLGIESVERNGHHYFRGLAHLPPAFARSVGQAHSDMYEEREPGFFSLAIHEGWLRLGSVNDAPFGLGLFPDLSAFPLLAPT